MLSEPSISILIYASLHLENIRQLIFPCHCFQICMQVLHQPLTLLDCLHTFCGFCLKEWFALQASRASSSNPSPISCPSCRAPVRDTRPDAKVTTLLDMYLQANPGRARDTEEKEEIRSKYTPGENVLPSIRVRRESGNAAEDRRVVEEVMEMSLREAGIGGSGSSESGMRHHVRDGARYARDENPRQRRRDREVSRNRRGGEETARPSTATDAASQARRIGHQSSLRSLLSTSDLDSSEMQEEILRQIMEEGILDGIDLNNIDVGQEDELSEKIAEAYRRRHGTRSRSHDNRAQQQRVSSSQGQRSGSNEPRQRRRPSRSPNPTDQTAQPSHPPVSRPHLLEAYPTGQGHRPRTSSETRQTRRQTSPTPPASGSGRASETRRQAARSATDLSNRPHTSNSAARSATDLSGRPESSSNQRIRPRDLSSGVRRTTDPANIVVSHPSVPALNSPRAASQNNQHVSRQADSARIAARAPSEPRIPVAASTFHPPEEPSVQSIAQVTYVEPSISCERCGKANLEHDLHMNCGSCIDGKYNLCLRCWRLGRGCLHWYGFGHNAMVQWDKKSISGAGYSPEHPLPHTLTGHRYLSPPSASYQHTNEVEQRLLTTSDPSSRFRSGPFCSNCSAFTPECFWECEVCNDGEWGYCNACVNQGKCCTHPLLPASYPLSNNPIDPDPSNATPHASSTTFSPIPTSQSQSTQEPFNESHIPLTFSTKCDICTYPIPPSTTRFHCPQCNDGDYDICTTCYLRLVKIGRISADNGPRGWRRCPNGHRMIVIGFEDSVQGQRRVVVEDLVGGHALGDSTDSEEGKVWRWRDESQQTQAKTMTPAAVNGRSLIGSASHPNNHNNDNQAVGTYPPNGGVGLRVLALWSYWPREGVEDELAFPRGAEIRECEDINGDWFLGIYCGRKGVFPGNYCRVLERVGG